MHHPRWPRRWPWVLVLTLSAWIPGASHGLDEFPSELRTIAAVRLEGRHRVGAKEIESVLKTRGPSFLPWRAKPVVRQDFLAADARAIEQVYRSQGFLDASVDYRLTPGRRPGSAVVTFRITEGERSLVSQVEIAGAQTVPRDQLLKRIYAKPGRPFNPSYLIADTSTISSAYKERGYLPHVIGSARRESLSVTVKYEINEGPRYRNGRVYVSSPGHLRFKEKLIRRELLLKPDEFYRASRAQRSVERLYESGLFNQVQLTPLVDSTHTRIEFDLRLRERKTRWIDAGVGSGTAERFRFTGEWGHRNLGARGLQGVAASRLAFDGQARFLLSRAEASLLEPWLAGTRTRGLVTVYHENRHDRANPSWVVQQSANGVSFEVRRDLGRYTRLGLIQDNSFVRQDISFRDPNLSPAVRDSLVLNVAPSYTTHRVRLGLVRDSRDDPLNPARGSVQDLTGDVAGGPLSGTSSFTKWQSTVTWYRPVRGWVLATRLRAGAIYPFGPQPRLSPGLDPQVARVPLEDRFRLGGVNTLRGYPENTVPVSGGLAMVLGNVELRVPVAGPFGLEFFLDAGNAWARPAYIKGRNFVPEVTGKRLDPSDVRYLFGVGARVNLPFGPLRVDFTWSPRPDERGEWRVAEPQFAIGPTF